MSSSTSVVTINAVSLPVLNYRDQRVITTEYLAQLYGTDVDNIRKNFSNNPDRFEQDRHFFKIDGDELREFKSCSSGIDKHTRNLTLWTERGAARHAKMLETDQAWEVFEKLEAAYFDGITPHRPDLDAVHHLAAGMAEAFLGYLTDEMANGPQALATLPPIQQAVARAITQRDSQRDSQRLHGKALVDYQDLRLFAGGALAARNVLDRLEILAQCLEAQCGQSLVEGLLKNPPAPADASSDYRTRVARFVAHRSVVTINDVIEGIGETATRSLRARTAYALQLLGWRKDYAGTGNARAWIATAQRLA